MNKNNQKVKILTSLLEKETKKKVVLKEATLSNNLIQAQWAFEREKPIFNSIKNVYDDLFKDIENLKGILGVSNVKIIKKDKKIVKGHTTSDTVLRVIGSITINLDEIIYNKKQLCFDINQKSEIIIDSFNFRGFKIVTKNKRLLEKIIELKTQASTDLANRMNNFDTKKALQTIGLNKDIDLFFYDMQEDVAPIRLKLKASKFLKALNFAEDFEDFFQSDLLQVGEQYDDAELVLMGLFDSLPNDWKKFILNAIKKAIKDKVYVNVASEGTAGVGIDGKLVIKKVKEAELKARGFDDGDDW